MTFTELQNEAIAKLTEKRRRDAEGEWADYRERHAFSTTATFENVSITATPRQTRRGGSAGTTFFYKIDGKRASAAKVAEKLN